MTKQFEIAFQKKPKGDIEFWGIRVASKNTVIADARDILESLREQGFRKARVFIEGKQIRSKRKGDV